MATTERERFEESIVEMEFSIAMNCLGLFRSITDCIKHLPIAALNSMLTETDMVTVMVYLIESSPWIRKRGEGFEKFESFEWHRMDAEELNIVSKPEAQASVPSNH